MIRLEFIFRLSYIPQLLGVIVEFARVAPLEPSTATNRPGRVLYCGQSNAQWSRERYHNVNGSVASQGVIELCWLISGRTWARAAPLGKEVTTTLTL